MKEFPSTFLGEIRLLFLNAFSLGIVPGLKISGGAYKDILRQPPTYIGPEGRITQVMQTIPGAGEPKPIPDVRVMITIDLMKFRPGDLKKQIGAIFR